MHARFGRIAASGAGLSLILGLSSCSGFGRGPASAAKIPTRDPLQLLESVRREMIPDEGLATGYGPDFSAQGYQVLIEWNETIRPVRRWAADYVRLDVTLPCCGAEHPFTDESENCACGHHKAMYGLAKRLLSTGHQPAAVQGEVVRWRAYLFPRETLQAEMERRALTDPAIRQALDDLRQRGIC
jgi:hypothetical protein